MLLGGYQHYTGIGDKLPEILPCDMVETNQVAKVGPYHYSETEITAVW
jgi:hypothetical protein